MAGVRRGPAPQPTELKRLRGNPGKRALPAPVVALMPVVASQPSPRPQSGTELREAILATKAAAWIAETDAPTLDLACLLYDQMLALLGDVTANGASYRSESRVSGVQYHPRPEYQLLLAVVKQYGTCLQLLGVTPSDRIRFGVQVEQAAKTNLQLLRERARAHREAGHRAS